MTCLRGIEEMKRLKPQQDQRQGHNDNTAANAYWDMEQKPGYELSFACRWSYGAMPHIQYSITQVVMQEISSYLDGEKAAASGL